MCGTNLLRLRFRAVGVTLAFALFLSPPVSATGFFINQQSVRGLGRVNAGTVVAADELATIFFNPAGLPRVISDTPDDRLRISIGAHLIVPRGRQRARAATAVTPGTLGAMVPVGGGDVANPTSPTPIPNLYSVWAPENSSLVLGAGVNVPFGLETRLGADWHGRYDATEASLRTINVSVVGAYRFATGLSVGGGLDLQYARTLLSTAIPNPLTPGGPIPSSDARSQTKGHDYVTPGFNVGAIWEISDETWLGAHYRSGMTHEIKGRSEFHGLPGPLADFNGAVDARAQLRLPAMASVGFRKRVTEGWVLLGNIDWFNWSVFDEVRIRFADGRPDAVRPSRYRDAYAVAGGAEFPVGSKWTGRAGVRWDTTPTVDDHRDTTVPDSKRLWFGVGSTWALSDALDVDFAFNHVFFDDTTLALTRTFFDNTPLATAVNINSDVTSVVNTIAIDFRLKF